MPERSRAAWTPWLVPAVLAVAALAAFAGAEGSAAPPRSATAVAERLLAPSMPEVFDEVVDTGPRPASESGAVAAPSNGDPLERPGPIRGEPDRAHPASTRAGEDRGGVAEPASVRIPAIDVDADLVELGLADDGAMEVPDFGDVGWYEPGPAPGEPGGAVIAAHYDSVDGPDAFYELADLEAGDEVTVATEDGRLGRWQVTGAEQTPKDELPTERMWPDTDEPRLTLITCGGVFDDRSGHYTHNHVVYAQWQGWDDG